MQWGFPFILRSTTSQLSTIPYLPAFTVKDMTSSSPPPPPLPPSSSPPFPLILSSSSLPLFLLSSFFFSSFSPLQAAAEKYSLSDLLFFFQTLIKLSSSSKSTDELFTNKPEDPQVVLHWGYKQRRGKVQWQELCKSSKDVLASIISHHHHQAPSPHISLDGASLLLCLVGSQLSDR